MDQSHGGQMSRWFAGALAVYFLIRFFSYVYPPGSLLNTLCASTLALVTLFLIIRRHAVGWIMVAAELILAGGGSYLSVGFLSLRTLLVPISLSAYAIAYRTELFDTIKKEKSLVVALTLFLTCAGFAAIHGIVRHHPLPLVIADTIPYLFVLYYFPIRTLANNEHLKKILTSIILAALISNLMFTLATFIAFSTEWQVLHNPYYRWYRDIAGGKITDLGLHFYRTVLNEHLVLTPLLIMLIGNLIYNSLQKNRCYYLCAATASLIILSINLTRIYYLALVVGLTFLFSARNFRRWLVYSACAASVLLMSFVSIHLLASRGQSLGLELFGLRLQSIAVPSIEKSSLSRMLLLPKILESIKQHTFIGTGLGSQVTVYSPVTKEIITTPQFDWGYLEMLSEFGLLGIAGWLVLSAYLAHQLYTIRSSPAMRPIMASVAALCVINITSPALFHVLGVVWFTLCLAATKHIKNSPLPDRSRSSSLM